MAKQLPGAVAADQADWHSEVCQVRCQKGWLIRTLGPGWGGGGVASEVGVSILYRTQTETGLLGGRPHCADRHFWISCLAGSLALLQRDWGELGKRGGQDWGSLGMGTVQ